MIDPRPTEPPADVPCGPCEVCNDEPAVYVIDGAHVCSAGCADAPLPFDVTGLEADYAGIEARIMESVIDGVPRLTEGLRDLGNAVTEGAEAFRGLASVTGTFEVEFDEPFSWRDWNPIPPAGVGLPVVFDRNLYAGDCYVYAEPDTSTFLRDTMSGPAVTVAEVPAETGRRMLLVGTRHPVANRKTRRRRRKTKNWSRAPKRAQWQRGQIAATDRICRAFARVRIDLRTEIEGANA